MDSTKNIALQGGLFLVLVYVFFNTVGLPHGLSYTFLLTPLFLYFSIKAKLFKAYTYLAILLIPFALIHFRQGTNLPYYLQSTALFTGAWVFGIAVYQFLKQEHALPLAMKGILMVNTLLLPIAFLAYFTPWKESWWYLVPISRGLPIIPRLMMLTYEASYYSLLLVPVSIYYLLKILFFKEYNAWLILILLGLPLLLSFSLGIWAGLAITLVILFAFHLKWLVLHQRLRITFIVFASLVLGSLVVLYLFYPENPLFHRLKNIGGGEDTSARGRTYEAFELAWLMAKEKSIWFGVGLGQIKLMGRDILLNFYHYTNIPEVARIPNAAAETLAQFGIVGLSLRLGTQLFLFWRTKVWSNFFRLSLFCFVFVYQFTGSFLINMAEISIWVLAFSPIAKEFNKANLREQWAIPVWPWEKKKGALHG
ncbi:MAG: hypothetical protein EP332_04815 [Bacteroidetes bacterium]|nr:MAG: hypothetical protein EP332_04815 [Bacteroidota bacterium]